MKLLTNKWLIRVLSLLGVAGIVNVLGPLFAFGAFRPLGTLTGQIIFVLLIVVGWLGMHLLKVQKAGKAEKKLVAEMVAPPLVPEGPDASQEERAKIQKRFEEAMAVLKKSRGRKGKLNLYDLPWYILIGPPGSGKTTALVNSGLRFPLADRFGPDAIRGVGGTRNCDWWFTDDAVLIDTAGRFTTQDSDANVDHAGWTSFLDLLKRFRKRRPINGILVALSVTDLLAQTEAQRQSQAQAIKERVAELDQHFGIRFPVYVLFTKCDLVAGFMEFFDDLGRAEREQVWGMTFQHSDDPEANPAAAFDAEYDLLLRRLNERLISRIAQERDLTRRGLMHGFPQQMLALKSSCAAFVRDVFEGSRYSKGSMLRGVYFTSGTQEGTPIDRLMGVLAKTFALDAQVLPAQLAGGGKSFFITDLLRKVAFSEAELAGASRRVELQRAWLQRGTYAGVAVVVVVLLVAWVFAFFDSRAYVQRMGEDVKRARELVSAVDSRNYDPLAVLPALDAVRALPGGYADQLAGGGWFSGWGLSQADKLGETAVTSYRRLLNQLFLPRVMLRLEGQLQRGGSSPDYVYEALKAYLMLDSKDHYDADGIRAFVELDWDTNLQRTVSTEQRAALGSHLAATFEQRPMPLPLPLNEAVIVQARREVRSLPLDERIYGRLKRTFTADIRGFNIRDAAGGPTADLVFVRKSGVPLDTPVAPLFTKQAYQNVFAERSEALVRELASESWILGEEQAVAANEEVRLLGLVRDRYLAEFTRVYTDTILDVGLVAFATPEEAARVFNLLSRPADSPLVLLLEEIQRQTSLDQREGAAVSASPGGVTEFRNRLQDVIGGTDRATAQTAAAAANPVTERFRPLADLVTAREGQPRPVDHLLGLLRDLYEYLTVVSSEAAGGSVPPNVQQQGQAVLQQLRVAAATQPDLLVGDL
ncbi:MAG TPA: type VI secretion system membrane subunit TssM, partial [Gammaproteobacteria bacterium]